jgi:predicted aspartyl protease
LYLKGYINGQPVNKMLVDTGAAINIMPYSVLRRLGRSTGDLIKTNVTLSDFNGQTSEAQGVLSVDLTIGNKDCADFVLCRQQQKYLQCFTWQGPDSH